MGVSCKGSQRRNWGGEVWCYKESANGQIVQNQRLPYNLFCTPCTSEIYPHSQRFTALFRAKCLDMKENVRKLLWLPSQGCVVHGIVAFVFDWDCFQLTEHTDDSSIPEPQSVIQEIEVNPLVTCWHHSKLINLTGNSTGNPWWCGQNVYCSSLRYYRQLLCWNGCRVSLHHVHDIHGIWPTVFTCCYIYSSLGSKFAVAFCPQYSCKLLSSFCPCAPLGSWSTSSPRNRCTSTCMRRIRWVRKTRCEGPMYAAGCLTVWLPHVATQGRSANLVRQEGTVKSLPSGKKYMYCTVAILP